MCLSKDSIHIRFDDYNCESIQVNNNQFVFSAFKRKMFSIVIFCELKIIHFGKVIINGYSRTGHPEIIWMKIRTITNVQYK